MKNEKRKAKNSNQPRNDEAVKLSGGLAVFLIPLAISFYFSHNALFYYKIDIYPICVFQNLFFLFFFYSFTSSTIKANIPKLHFCKLDTMPFAIWYFFEFVFVFIKTPIISIFKKESTILPPIDIFNKFVTKIRTNGDDQ